MASLISLRENVRRLPVVALELRPCTCFFWRTFFLCVLGFVLIEAFLTGMAPADFCAGADSLLLCVGAAEYSWFSSQPDRPSPSRYWSKLKLVGALVVQSEVFPHAVEEAGTTAGVYPFGSAVTCTTGFAVVLSCTTF